METDIETKYCQSCGMPLGIEGITAAVFRIVEQPKTIRNIQA